MLEIVLAKNGSQVLRQDGFLLASEIDPLLEARAWMNRRTRLLRQVKTVFVLGAGAGYHIAELTAVSKAKVMVIELSAEIVEACQKIHGFPEERVQFTGVQSVQALRANSAMKAAMAQSFLTLQHGPSVARAPGFYGTCEQLLAGRDWAGLNWQWRLKGFAPLEDQARIDGGREPALSIYDLEKTDWVQNSPERARMIVKALRELVK